MKPRLPAARHETTLRAATRYPRLRAAFSIIVIAFCLTAAIHADRFHHYRREAYAYTVQTAHNIQRFATQRWENAVANRFIQASDPPRPANTEAGVEPANEFNADRVGSDQRAVGFEKGFVGQRGFWPQECEPTPRGSTHWIGFPPAAPPHIDGRECIMIEDMLPAPSPYYLGDEP